MEAQLKPFDFMFLGTLASVFFFFVLRGFYRLNFKGKTKADFAPAVLAKKTGSGLWRFVKATFVRMMLAFAWLAFFGLLSVWWRTGDPGNKAFCDALLFVGFGGWLAWWMAGPWDAPRKHLNRLFSKNPEPLDPGQVDLVYGYLTPRRIVFPFIMAFLVPAVLFYTAVAVGWAVGASDSVIDAVPLYVRLTSISIVSILSFLVTAWKCKG